MRRPPVTAAVLSAGLTALGLAQSLGEGRPGVATAGLLLGTLAVLLLRDAPLALAAAAAASVAVQAGRADDPAFASFLVLLVTAYALGRRCSASRVAAGLALLAAGIGALLVADPSLRSAAELVYPVVYLGGATGLGRLVRSRERQAAAALEASELAAATREREALAQERARIAREMHDVVAHSVSLLVLQAESAAAVLDRDPERARTQLERVSTSGRQALDELRRVLGLLRADDDPSPSAPQPALADLPRLVADARTAGLQVDLEMGCDLGDLPPGVQLTAYRVVQEALTNAVRHGRATHAQVAVRHGDAALALDVRDDGAGPAPGWSPGHGLRGMRERVRLYDGQLDIGPGPAGGFAVRARLPVRR